jgi:hypothetical protein
MLGFYTNFPQTLHRTSDFLKSTSTRRAQQVLIETMFRLNSETFRVEEVSIPSLHDCSVIFEFGIADGNDFNYVDAEEKTILLKTVNKKPLKIMDFVCIIRYYKTEHGKKAHLRFDYYMVRFRFNENVEIQVSHEKGPMHVSPEDLVEFVTGRINKASPKRVLKPADD